MRRAVALGREPISLPPWAVAAVAAVVAGVAGGVLTAAVSPLAGFAALAGLLLAGAMLLNTQAGLIAFVVVASLLPFGVIPVPIGGLKPTFLDATLTVVLMVWLLRNMRSREERLVGSPLDGLLLLFIGLAITSFVLGVNSVTAEAGRFFLKTINSILFFFSVTNCVRSRAQLEQLVRAFVLAAGAAALVAIVLYLQPETAVALLGRLRVLGYPTSDILRYIASTDILRATGTSIDPNVLGGTLMLALPVAIGQLVGKAPIIRARYALPLVGLMLAALALTFSRSAWVGLALALLFMAAMKHRRLFLLMIALAALVYFLPQGEIFIGRLVSGFTIQDQAAAMRLGEYKDALRLISQYPWLGVGFGRAPSIDLYVAASSIYLLMAEQIGLVGLSVFLAIAGVLLFYTIRGARLIAEPRLQTLQVGVLGSVVAALSAGLLDHYFFNFNFPHTVALFWFVVGLSVAATRLGAQGGEAKPQPPPR